MAMTSPLSGSHIIILTGNPEHVQEGDELCPARDSDMPCRRRRGRGPEVVWGSRGVQVAHLRGGAHGGPVWPIQQAGRRRRAAAHPQPEAHTGGPSLSSRMRPEHMLCWLPAVLLSGPVWHLSRAGRTAAYSCTAPAAHLMPGKLFRGSGVSRTHVMQRIAEQPDGCGPRQAGWTLRAA